MNYVATKLRQELFVKSVISIHYFEYTADFEYSGESHDFWELIFCDKGELVITAGDNGMILKRGQAFLHPPRQYHNVHAYGGRSANSIIVSFKCDTRQLYLAADRIIITDGYIETALFSVLNEAKHSFENELGRVVDERLIRKDRGEFFASEQIIQNYIELLLIHIIRQMQGTGMSAVPVHASGGRLLDRTLEYMGERLGERVTFGEITQAMSVSPTTLKMLFSRTYGHGVMEHLTGMRLERAKEMLRDGRYSCTDISAACGFCSVHHFSAVFKKNENMSPTQYVKSIKSMLEEGRTV